MISQDKEIQGLINQIKKLTVSSAKVGKIINFFQSKILSNNNEDCLVIQKILSYSQGDSQNPALAVSPKQIAQTILKSIKSVKSLSIFLVLYNAWDRCKRTTYQGLDWRYEYERKRSEGIFESFNQWASSTFISEGNLCCKVLMRVLNVIPTLFHAQKIRSTYLQFDSCIQWLSLFVIKNRDDYVCANRVALLVKEMTDIKLQDYEKKEHLILRRIIELLGNAQRKNGSLILFFDKFTIRSEDIEYFINIKQDFFQDLDQTNLCNVIVALAQSGLNKEILELISKISSLLKSNQQYFTLRTIYEGIILPIIALKYKSHKLIGNQVFQFVLFYVAGFLIHCSIGKQGLQCLLDNIKQIEDPRLKNQWAELALLSCKQDAALKNYAQKQLKKIGLAGLTSTGLYNFVEKQKMIWTVTMHNGRKLKKYPQIESYRFRGIQNLNNQCYIISVVQALYTTRELRTLVIQLKPEIKQNELKLFDQFKYLFELDLNINNKDNKATVRFLKNVGPQDFKNTLLQEDAQQYLVKLFQSLEQQLKKTKNGLQTFYDIFRCQFIIKICCKQCLQQRQLKDHEFFYVNTYGTKQNFQMTREEPLDENYKCQKCSAKKCIKINQLINKPRILILHINRFRHNQGVTKKILGNNPIKRIIGDYRLVGFVAHKGSFIHAGHYQYYSRIDQTRWALFNDNKVTQFNVADDEEFQREFRAENTPYILFYRPRKEVEK